MTDDYGTRTINTADAVTFRKSGGAIVGAKQGPTITIPEAICGGLTPSQIGELYGAMFAAYDAKLREFDD